jgi:hypothetical protein
MAWKPEDIKKWNDVIRAFMPTAALAVDGIRAAITGIIRLVRRTEGRPESQPEDDVLIAELTAQVVASLTKAQKPWEQIRDTADRELKD